MIARHFCAISSRLELSFYGYRTTFEKDSSSLKLSMILAACVINFTLLFNLFPPMQELKKAELAKVQEENRYLTTTFEQAQQRLSDLNRNFDDSMALLTEKIHRLSAAKKKAEQDKLKYQAEIEKSENTLSQLKNEKEKENEENNKKLEDLDKEYHEIVRENEEADAEIASAQAEVSRAKAQLAALRTEHKKLSEQYVSSPIPIASNVTSGSSSPLFATMCPGPMPQPSPPQIPEAAFVLPFLSACSMQY